MPNTYTSYLGLEKLLSAQVTKTSHDSELLFIIMHQTKELWFKLALHELDVAISHLKRVEAGDDDALLMSYKALARVTSIQRALTDSWNVLTTLTPDEFREFREAVGKDGASGFQSVQYRLFEFKLGARYREIKVSPKIDPINIVSLAPNSTRNDLEVALVSPSLYDAAISVLAYKMQRFGISPRREGFDKRHVSDRKIHAAWQAVYEDRTKHPDMYQLAEKLIDLEDSFRRWRFAHLATVSRIIGGNTGTGGSSGLKYLKSVVDESFERPLFPELWLVRQAMFGGPPSAQSKR